MYAIENDNTQEQTVTMFVSDPAQSQEFYQDLFGLVLREPSDSSGDRVLLTPDGDLGVSLVFRPRREDSEGPIWLSVEVTSVSEVLDVYLLAVMMGAKSLLPRKRGSRWATVVTDADGNRISVWTTVDEHSESDLRATAMRPVRWEWRLSKGCELNNGELARTTAPSPEPAWSSAGMPPGRLASGLDRLNRGHGQPDEDCDGCRRTPGRDKALEGKE